MNARGFRVRFVATIACIFSVFYAWPFIQEMNRSSRRCTNTKLKIGNSVNLSTTPSTSEPKCSSFLVIIVISSPEKLDRRNAIRHTWAKRIRQAYLDIPILEDRQYTSIVKTVFLLGQSKSAEVRKLVQAESRHFGDIVLGEFTDTYTNLTMKTKMGLGWTYRRCKFQYLLKTDDDVFVNVNGLVKWIWKLPRTNLYTGRCDVNKSVIRVENHKWGVSKDIYPRDQYPAYCVGMGYILSKDVLQTIMTVIQSQPLFPLEDVYVGLMIEKFNIKPVDNRYHFQVNYDYSGDICGRKHMLLSHEADVIQTLQLHLKYLDVNKCT